MRDTAAELLDLYAKRLARHGYAFPLRLQEYEAFKTSHPELLWLLDAPDTMVTVNPSPDCFEFFVVGASAGRSQFCFGGTNSVTKPVRRV